MSDSCEHQKQSANRRNHQKFPGKLWRLVHSCKSGAIRWGYRGNSVIINAVRFRKQYLERPNLVFKTSNMSSFIRQLNLYGFRKLNVNRNVRPFDFNTHEEALQFNRERQRLANGEHPITETFYEFQNEYFVKGQKELLCNIKRNIGVRKVKEDIHLNREAFLQSGYFLTKNNDLFHDLYKENMPPGSPITCDHDEKTSDHSQHFPNLTNDQGHQDIAMSSMKTSTDYQNSTNESDSSAGRVRERSLTELLPSLKKQRTQTCMPNDDSIAHTVTSRHQPCSRKSIIECTSVNQDRDRQFSPSTYPNQMCSQTIGIVQETLPILHKQYLEFGENTVSRTMAHPATHDDGRSFFKVSSARLGDITENQSISGVGYSSNAYPSTYDFGQYMAHNTSYFDGREYRPGYHCIPMAPISKIKSESIEHSQGGFQANTNWTYMAAPSTPVPHELFMNTAHFSNQRSIQVAGLIPAPKSCASYTGGGQFQQNSCMYPVPRTFNYSPYPPHQPDPTHSQLPMHLPQSSNHSPDVKNRGPTFEPDVRYLQQFSSSTEIREKNDDVERATKDAMIPIVDVPEGSPMVLRKADFNNLVHAIDKVIKTNPGAWLTFLGLSGLQNSEFATTSIKVLQSLNILVDDSENNDESRHQENYSV